MHQWLPSLRMTIPRSEVMIGPSNCTSRAPPHTRCVCLPLALVGPALGRPNIAATGQSVGQAAKRCKDNPCKACQASIRWPKYWCQGQIAGGQGDRMEKDRLAIFGPDQTQSGHKIEASRISIYSKTSGRACLWKFTQKLMNMCVMVTLENLGGLNMSEWICEWVRGLQAASSPGQYSPTQTPNLRPGKKEGVGLPFKYFTKSITSKHEISFTNQDFSITIMLNWTSWARAPGALKPSQMMTWAPFVENPRTIVLYPSASNTIAPLIDLVFSYKCPLHSV